jgi:hypothetical protein
MKPDYANYPWVFWITIRYRPRWFKRFWESRGANYVEYQLWVFQVIIGRPWLRGPVESHQRDFGSAKYVHNCNKENLRHWFSFKMKSPMNNR